MNINTNNTSSLSREDLESGYNHLLQVTRDHIDRIHHLNLQIESLKVTRDNLHGQLDQIKEDRLNK